MPECLPNRNGRVGYNRNNIKILYKMNKKAEIIVDTRVCQTESIIIKEIVKQRSIFGPVICYATKSKVNNIGKTVQYSYGKIDIGMSDYVDDIVAEGGIAEIRKGIRNCVKTEKEKKMTYGLKKTKYMMVKARKEREEIVQKDVKSGAVQKTKKDISTSSFSNLYWYHNGDRNMTILAKNPICNNDTLSHRKNCDNNSKVKQLIEEQEQNQFKNTLYQKV